MDGNQIIENLRAQQSGYSFFRLVDIKQGNPEIRPYAPGVDALPRGA